MPGDRHFGLKLNLPYGGNENVAGLDLGLVSINGNSSALQVNLSTVPKLRRSASRPGECLRRLFRLSISLFNSVKASGD